MSQSATSVVCFQFVADFRALSQKDNGRTPEGLQKDYGGNADELRKLWYESRIVENHDIRKEHGRSTEVTEGDRSQTGRMRKDNGIPGMSGSTHGRTPEGLRKGYGRAAEGCRKDAGSTPEEQRIFINIFF